MPNPAGRPNPSLAYRSAPEQIQPAGRDTTVAGPVLHPCAIHPGAS